jgi:hypothetical protein
LEVSGSSKKGSHESKSIKEILRKRRRGDWWLLRR